MLAALMILASVADADRQQLPQSERPYVYYFDTSDLPKPYNEYAVNALKFVCPSVSRKTVLEHQIPVQVAPDLYRIDIRGLGWDYKVWWHLLSTEYPYRDKMPLVIKASWFIQWVTDAQQSKAYYLLLYGRELKDRDDFLQQWDVFKARQDLTFGFMERQSGVSKQKIRVLRSLAAPRASAWGTADWLRIGKGTDPLDDLSKQKFTTHDGEEWIVPIQKLSKLGTRGVLQAYLLSDARGKIINKADGDLVEDHTKFKNFAQIRVPGSCIQCHVQGLNLPTANRVAQYIASGGEVYAYPKKIQEEIERFYLGNHGKGIKRNNEDYADIIKLCNGLTPEENQKQFEQIVQFYVADVSLEQAAREVGTDKETFQKAMGLASAAGYKVPPVLIELTHGNAIARSSWEDSYIVAKEFLKEWEHK